MSWFRRKVGKHECERCHGAGCYYCERRGYVLMCPNCQDIDSQVEDEGAFRCGVCDTEYKGTGEIEENPDPYEEA